MVVTISLQGKIATDLRGFVLSKKKTVNSLSANVVKVWPFKVLPASGKIDAA